MARTAQALILYTYEGVHCSSGSRMKWQYQYRASELAGASFEFQCKFPDLSSEAVCTLDVHTCT